MKVLAVDIGTNSTLHLIADVSGDPVQNISLIERGIIGNGLGAKIGPDGRIGAELLSVNRNILSKLVQLAQQHNCIRCEAVGTHALRKLVNRDDFLRMARDVGMPLRIIADEEEAKLSWRGVFGADGQEHLTGLIDIGGGSTELIIGRGTDIQMVDSVPVGAVTLTRNYMHREPDHPPLPGEISEAKRFIRESFDHWTDKLPADADLFGVAGTVTAIAGVEHKIVDYQPGLLEGIRLGADQVTRWRDQLLMQNVDGRRNIPGMPPARADSIHAGAMILSELMTCLNVSGITVSEKGVLFGLALELGLHH